MMEIKYELKAMVDEVENKSFFSSALDNLIEDVPTDVSGKWVNRDNLKAFGQSVACYIISTMEKDQEFFKIIESIHYDFDL